MHRPGNRIQFQVSTELVCLLLFHFIYHSCLLRPFNFVFNPIKIERLHKKAIFSIFSNSILKNATFQFPLSHFRTLQKMFNHHQQSLTEMSANGQFKARIWKKRKSGPSLRFSRRTQVQVLAALPPSSRGGVSKCKAAHLRLPVQLHLDCPLTLLPENEQLIKQIPQKINPSWIVSVLFQLLEKQIVRVS